MLLGLGWPQWLTIIAMVGALLLTFKVMARASVAYERKRRERERAAGEALPEDRRKEEPR
jgi:hypothetical protein